VQREPARTTHMPSSETNHQAKDHDGHFAELNGTVRRASISELFKNQFFCFFLFFAAATALSWQCGAFQAEFADTPDEPAHYVTGLMVRDYLASGAPAAPMQYAENYYRHYPKVGLGHWPPMFYIVEAAWMLIFSASRWSVLLLMSAQAAALALLLQNAVSKDLPRVYGAIAGLFLLSLPLVRRLSYTVMSELLVTLLVFAAVLKFGEYVALPDWRRAAAFGLIASLAILTKGSGIVLALVPPITVLLTGRIDLLRQRSFWLPVAIVLAFCGPWYLMAPMALNQDTGALGSVHLHRRQMLGSFNSLLRIIGILPSVFAVVGVCQRLARPFREQEGRFRWAALAALLLGFLTLRIFVGAASEARHLILVVPPTLLFAAAGASWLVRRGSGIGVRSWFTAVPVAGALIWALWVNVYNAPKKNHYGIDEAALSLLSRSDLHDATILVSSDATGEGGFIAELAMREKRPGHVVVRASKALASSNWMGSFYTLQYKTPEELLKYLEESRTAVVVIIDPDLERQSVDLRLLLMLPGRFPNQFELLGTYPNRDSPGTRPGSILVYRFKAVQT
jgi:hypothetical protein